MSALVSPPAAQAAIHIPGVPVGIPNPLDLGLPGPTDLIGKVFEFFFKTFFGIQAKVTQRTVEWLLAAPVYTDQSAYGDSQPAAREHRGRGVGAVHARVHGLGRPLLRLRVHLGGLLRGGRVARRAAAWPPGRWRSTRRSSASLAIATNYLTYGVIHDPTVGSGLTKVLAGRDGLELHAARASGRSRRSSRS